MPVVDLAGENDQTNVPNKPPGTRAGLHNSEDKPQRARALSSVANAASIEPSARSGGVRGLGARSNALGTPVEFLRPDPIRKVF